MAMVFSLFGSFTVLVIYKIIMGLANYTISMNECIGYPSALYCFTLSAFFWMNVMSFDIWWTLRRMTNRVTISGNRNNRKFLIYCAYAWGLPIAMTIALVLMENADLTHMPWIIKPNIVINACFLEGKEKLLYLYTPMLILILCNSMFFLITAYNIWRSGNEAKILHTDITRKQNIQKQRFLIYLKLSLIMGISYVLEFVSSFYPDFLFWYITDAYNMLIGVAIFFIFVCKKKIFIKLSQRFQRRETNDNTESHPMNYSLSTSRNYPL
ncbi:G-protein coupled receptor Mth2-like [Melitaea cinxia]|uniref:G-protein coupled receptor Mth2-like n=1 Tax=Melitaea cinxia TaxID=113334 RepID=UPI001E272A00|nr:G-protein coupled receptor Mth2-like [Melitaea cinxia]